MKKLSKILFLLLALPTLSNAQTYTLAIESTFPTDQALLVYEPLQKYLANKTGLDIVLDTQENYYFYWREARTKTPEFSLDAAHVAAYRIQEKGYEPLVRAVKDISFHLVSLDEQPSSQTLDQFMVGKKVVMLPNPSLASMFFDQWFTDLFMQPAKVVTALSWEDTIEQVFSQQDDAAIIPNWLFEQYPNFVSLKQSKSYPGLTLLASSAVSDRVKKTVTDAMLALHEDNEYSYVLPELNTDNFKQANIEDYQALEDLLSQLRY